MSADAERGLLGSVERVTVSIPADGPGEVALPGTRRDRGLRGLVRRAGPRHRRVAVVECLSARSLLVTPLP